jgi:phosphate butyryltransferase
MLLEGLVKSASALERKVVAVAQAADSDVLKAVVNAHQFEIADFILIGDQEIIHSILSDLNYDVDHFTLIHELDAKKASQLAVRQVIEGKADILMKGLVSTADLLKAVLDKEHGLRTSKLISHVATFEVEGYDRLLFVTDAAMNIAPDLKEKVEIIRNCVEVARSLGVENPRVAPVCPVEVVNPAMQSTVDAASLTLMGNRGQIKGCIIDGPLALDNAISIEAAKHKRIRSEVAGRADILLVPTIEVGNVLYKSLVYFAKAKVGALVVGAKAPVILTSRADSDQAKLNSIALAAHYTVYHSS